MNDSELFPPSESDRSSFADISASSLLVEVEKLIRRHPVAATLATLGIGCAIGAAARELLKPPHHTTKQRAVQLLEDIQERLAEFAEPVGDRVSELAEDGVSAVKSGLHSISRSKSANRLRHWFS